MSNAHSGLGIFLIIPPRVQFSRPEYTAVLTSDKELILFFNIPFQGQGHVPLRCQGEPMQQEPPTLSNRDLPIANPEELDQIAADEVPRKDNVGYVFLIIDSDNKVRFFSLHQYK